MMSVLQTLDYASTGVTIELVDTIVLVALDITWWMGIIVRVSDAIYINIIVQFLCFHVVCIYIFAYIWLDTDECLELPCDHNCNNTEGSFICSCRDGYLLDDDRLSCNGEL